MMADRFGQIQAHELPPRQPRTEAQVACPCDNLMDVEVVERDGFPRGRFLRECLDCGFTEVGRVIRPATQPDEDH